MKSKPVRHRKANAIKVGDKTLADLLHCEQLDLRDVDLHSAALRKLHLQRAKLFRCDLRNADLMNSEFVSSDLSLSDFRKSNLACSSFVETSTDSAVFDQANLKRSSILSCRWYGADLRSVDLRQSQIANCHFTDIDFRGANLAQTMIGKCMFMRCHLSEANFAESSMSTTSFFGCDVDGADFSDSRMYDCIFAEMDISNAKGLASIQHGGPSSLGIEVVFRASKRLPNAFLLGTGVPQIIVDYLDSLRTEPYNFDSSFISYSSTDQTFASYLYFALSELSIRCWLFSEDAGWGEGVWHEIDRSIRVHDRVVLICSENSLNSAPVLRELERALQREDSERKNVLFPVRIDNYIFEKWEHPRKADVIAKVVGDFTDWHNSASFRKSVGRLVESLRKR